MVKSSFFQGNPTIEEYTLANRLSISVTYKNGELQTYSKATARNQNGTDPTTGGIGILAQGCIDWYLVTYDGYGMMVGETYLGTTCVAEFDNGGGGAGGTGTGDEYEMETWVFEKILDLLTTPCLKYMLGKAKDVSDPKIAKAIKAFSGNNPKYTWQVQEGSLPSGRTGRTTKDDSGMMITTLDPNKMRNASDLAIMRTILHESLHAYMTAYLSDHNQLQFFSDFAGTLKAYDDLLRKTGSIDVNALQHAGIAEGFVQSIADALQLYGASQGYSYDTQFYTDLAWGGLHETEQFNKLPFSDQDRILKRLAVEQGEQSMEYSHGGRQICN